MMRCSLATLLISALAATPLLGQTELVDVTPTGRRCRNADFPKDLPKAESLADLTTLMPALSAISGPKGAKVVVTGFYGETGAFTDAVAIASSLDGETTQAVRTAIAGVLRDTEEPGPWAARLVVEWKGDKVEVKSERPQLCDPAPLLGEEAPGASSGGSRGPQGASTSRRSQRPQRRMIAYITVTETGEVTKAELISGPTNLNKDDFEQRWTARKLQPALLDGRPIPYVWQPR
jgi:hypothetical protein